MSDIEIQKQIDYWRDGSDEDWVVAEELIETERIRHELFFAHLALEKMLKAHVCRETEHLAPKIHNLVRLAKLSKLPFSKPHEIFLSRFDMYQLEGRYPDRLPAPPKKSEAKKELQTAREVRQWLKKQL